MKLSRIILFLLIIILIINISYGASPFDQQADAEDTKEEQDKAQKAIDEGTSYSGTLPANTQITLPGGGSATVSGKVQVVGGKIKSADSISYGGASITGAADFQQSGDGYTVSSATELKQNGNIITNGQGITYSGGKLTAKKYDSFTGPDATTTTNGEDLNQQQNEIDVSKADTLMSGGVNFNDIEDTHFTIYSNAVVAEPEKNVTLNIIDSDGNEITFQATDENSSIIVSKESPAKYKITKGILKSNYSGIVEAVIGNAV